MKQNDGARIFGLFRKAAPAAFLVLCMGFLSCASSRIPLARWEKGARGRYYASYSMGVQGGEGDLILSEGDSWTGALYGPMHVPLFSVDLSDAHWTIVYGGKGVSFDPCPLLRGTFLERVMNGDFSEIPSSFECQGWTCAFDGPSGRLMGSHPDGGTFFLVWSYEKPPAHISLEMPDSDFSVELVLKDIWKPKPQP